MLIDITLKITSEMAQNSGHDGRKELVGHIGTHFDVMHKEFPLEYTQRKGIVFDVRNVKNRDIELSDIDISRVEKNTFVAFCTEFIEKEGYGKGVYFSEHPQLSDELIGALLDFGVSIIGVDFAGIRRGKEHIPKDRYCAERGTFVIENLCNLASLLKFGAFTAHTYPMSYVGLTGLPCRVIAETVN